MIGELVAATTGLRAISDMVVGLQNLKTTAEVHAKAIELNQKILSVQQELFAAHMKETALVEQVGELKGEIARMKNWDAEKQRYELAAPFPGCMVYALKKSVGEGKTPHYLCPGCYQKGQPSILQGREGRVTKGAGKSNAAFICDVCGSAAETNSPWVPTPQYFEDIVPQG